MSGIKFLGTGMYVSDVIVSNKDFEKVIDTSDEWIKTRTGINYRHISNNEPNWSMGFKSAKDAIANAGISPDELDLILYTTVTPDYFTPSMSCIIQGMLEAKNAACIDINCACAGFVYAVDMACRYMAFGDIKNVLVVSGEVLSRVTDFSDRSTCVLFGDGAASCVLQASDNLFASVFKAEGESADKIFARAFYNKLDFLDKLSEYPLPDTHFHSARDNFLHMNGTDVYKFATRVIPDSIKIACEKAGISINDLDCIVSHQANIRIIETAASKLGVSIDKFYLNLHKYGNTSSASIPICLHELISDGKVKRGDKVCLVGFGAGLTYGAVVFEF